MEVKKISYPTPLEQAKDITNDNFDVFVDIGDGVAYTVVVGTPKNLLEMMKEDNKNYLEPFPPFILVRELTYENVEQAIRAYCEGNAYWLKENFLSGTFDIEYLDEQLRKISKEQLEFATEIDAEIARLDELEKNK